MFSVDCIGFVLVEGGLVLVFEDWDYVIVWGVCIYGEMVGYGMSCDYSYLVCLEVVG